MMVKSRVINAVEWQLFKSDNPDDLIGPYYVVKKYKDGTKLRGTGLPDPSHWRRLLRTAHLEDVPRGKSAPSVVDGDMVLGDFVQMLARTAGSASREVRRGSPAQRKTGT